VEGTRRLRIGPISEFDWRCRSLFSLSLSLSLSLPPSFSPSPSLALVFSLTLE
jgi:hypothetical protein